MSPLEDAGNAGCLAAPMAPRTKESTRVSHHRLGRSTGIPCATVLTAYGALSPVIGFLATVISCDASASSRNLMPASRHQDHTLSPSAFCIARQPMRKRPPHPAPNVRDDREAPSLEGCGTREDMPVICPTSQAATPATFQHDGQSSRRRRIDVKINLVPREICFVQERAFVMANGKSAWARGARPWVGKGASRPLCSLLNILIYQENLRRCDFWITTAGVNLASLDRQSLNPGWALNE
jgi:hypothetical protein